MSGGSQALAGIAFGVAVASFAAFQQFKLPVVLPVLLERYGYDRVVAGGFMSVFALSGLLLSMRIGRAIERGGARRPLLLAMALLACGGALALVAPDRQLVVLGARALEGVAFTVLAVAGPFLASTNATARQRPVVIGLIATWIPLGQLLATGLAPIALATVGWQLLWWIALAGTAAFAWWTGRLRATGLDPAPRRAADRTETARAATEPEPAAAEPRGTPRTLLLATVLFVLWSAQYIAFATWLPQYLVEARGLGLTGALEAYVLSALVVMLANVAAGFAMRAGVPLGTILVFGLTAQTAPWWLGYAAPADAGAVALLVVFSAGAGLVPTCLFALPNALGVSGGAAARSFGTLMTGRNLGVLIGPVLLAQVVVSQGDWSTVGTVFGTVTGAAAVLAAVIAGRLRRAGRTA